MIGDLYWWEGDDGSRCKVQHVGRTDYGPESWVEVRVLEDRQYVARGKTVAVQMAYLARIAPLELLAEETPS